MLYNWVKLGSSRFPIVWLDCIPRGACAHIYTCPGQSSGMSGDAFPSTCPVREIFVDVFRDASQASRIAPPPLYQSGLLIKGMLVIFVSGTFSAGFRCPIPKPTGSPGAAAVDDSGDRVMQRRVSSLHRYLCSFREQRSRCIRNASSVPRAHTSRMDDGVSHGSVIIEPIGHGSSITNPMSFSHLVLFSRFLFTDDGRPVNFPV